MDSADFTVEGAVRDWHSAKEGILWTRQKDGSVRLQSRGLELGELEELLMTLAADVHTQRTKIRAGAVILEDGMVSPLYDLLYQQAYNIPIPLEPLAALASALQQLHIKRTLQ